MGFGETPPGASRKRKKRLHEDLQDWIIDAEEERMKREWADDNYVTDTEYDSGWLCSRAP